MNKTPKTLSVTPTPGEYLAAGRAAGRISKNTAVKAAVTLLLILCAVSFFQQYIIPKNSRPNEILGILLILLSAGLIYSVWFRPGKSEARLLRQLSQKGSFYISFDCGADGITVKNNLSEYQLLKGEELVWKYSREMIVLFSPKNGELAVIPARAADEENYALIKEYLNENFKPAGLD